MAVYPMYSGKKRAFNFPKYTNSVTDHISAWSCAVIVFLSASLTRKHVGTSPWLEPPPESMRTRHLTLLVDEHVFNWGYPRYPRSSDVKPITDALAGVKKSTFSDKTANRRKNITATVKIYINNNTRYLITCILWFDFRNKSNGHIFVKFFIYSEKRNV